MVDEIRKTYREGKLSFIFLFTFFILSVWAFIAGIDQKILWLVFLGIIGMPIFLFSALASFLWRLDLTSTYIIVRTGKISLFRKKFYFSDIKEITYQCAIAPAFYYFKGKHFISGENFTFYIVQGSPSQYKEVVRHIILRCKVDTLVDDKVLRKVGLVMGDVGKEYVALSKEQLRQML